MRKTMKKTIALLLTVVMLLSLSIPMVGAVEATSTTYPTYAEAADGDLLYKINFNENKYTYSYINNTTATTEASTDGSTLTLKSNTTSAAYHTVGGEVAGLPLTGSSVYTVEFSTTLPSTGFVGLAPAANTTSLVGGYGFAVKAGSAKRDTADFSNGKMSGWSNYTNIDDTDSKYSFRLVIDETNETVDFYYLNTSKEWINLNIGGTGFKPTTDNLYLCFGTYSQDDAVISNVKIYKGDRVTWEECGNLLYKVNFNENKYAYSYMNNITATTEASTDGSTLTLKSNTTSAAYHTVGGEVAGLPLTGSSVYTVEFSTTLPSTGFVGLAPAANTTSLVGGYGFAVKAGSAKRDTADFSNGKMSGWSNYTNIDDTDSKYSFRLVIDETNETVDFYYLNTSKEWINLNIGGTGFKPTTDNLYLCFGTYSQDDAVISNVKIYSTSHFVKVIDGNTEDTIAINEEEYTLPAATKAGYMFQGWKVNGAETVTNVGEKVSTENLKTLEKVFVPVMSEIWWQAAKIYDGETDTGKRDVRFVSAIDSLNYKSIGYDVTITYGGNSYDNNNFDLKHVYSSLLASYGSEVVTLETLGYDDTNGGYITAFVIKNVPNNVGDITVELTPYQVTPDGTKVTGDVITVTLTAEKLNK